jgi:spoIIIJ-associated protein
MDVYEFEGKTTEEAIETACRKLHLSKDRMTIEVLEPGSAGIFGLVGGRKAKIRVVPPEKEIPEETFFDDGSESPEPERPEESNKPDEPNEADLLVAKESLEQILSLIPITTTVRAEKNNGRIALGIEGDSSGLLIGRRGRTLDALQYIVNKIVNKALEKRVQVQIDSENYRERRRETLAQMALKMGDKAKKTNKPVTTNLLNPHDRRIVHLTLRDDNGLDTKSRGDGILKKVVIIPKR